jgi:hypothetical protein
MSTRHKIIEPQNVDQTYNRGILNVNKTYNRRISNVDQK